MYEHSLIEIQCPLCNTLWYTGRADHGNQGDKYPTVSEDQPATSSALQAKAPAAVNQLRNLNVDDLVVLKSSFDSKMNIQLLSRIILTQFMYIIYVCVYVCI